MGRDLLRRSYGNNITAAVAALRAKVNDIIRRFDDIKIMFYNQNGITIFSQAT